MRVTVISIVIGALRTVRKTWKGDWKSWKSEDKSRLSKERETLRGKNESLLIAVQNNAISTNHIKARIDKIKKVDVGYVGHRDEKINHIISECSKLAQKEYKTRHDGVGKVIQLELCKKFIFDHTNKWYIHSPESVLENDTHKLLCEFDIQTHHLISAKRLDLIIINKKENKKNCGLWCPG